MPERGATSVEDGKFIASLENKSSMGLLSMRDAVSVSLLVPSSEKEATLKRTMIAAATSPTETRYRSTPSVSLALSIRSLEMDILPILGSRLGSSISLTRISATELAFSLAARTMEPIM
jgi:hypothetical protein